MAVPSVGDEVPLPEMNGTLVELIRLTQAPFRTAGDAAKATQKMATLLMHIYQVERANSVLLIDMQKRLAEHTTAETQRARWFTDKVLPQLVTVAIMSLLYLVFGRSMP